MLAATSIHSVNHTTYNVKYRFKSVIHEHHSGSPQNTQDYQITERIKENIQNTRTSGTEVPRYLQTKLTRVPTYWFTSVTITFLHNVPYNYNKCLKLHIKRHKND